MPVIETITAFRYDGNVYETEAELRAHLVNTRKMEAVAALSEIFSQVIAIDPEGMMPTDRASFLSRFADDIARWSDVLREPLTEAEYLHLHGSTPDADEENDDNVMRFAKGSKFKL